MGRVCLHQSSFRAVIALLGVMILLTGSIALGQTPQPVEKPAEKPAEKPVLTVKTVEPATAKVVVSEATPEEKVFRGRLPNYYSTVVDTSQRERIYAIQKEYHLRIDALKAQLEALLKERDTKVVDVLSLEQKAKVEQAKAAAQSLRDKKKAG